MASTLLNLAVDIEGDRVRLRITRVDSPTVVTGYLTRDEAWRLVQHLIRAAEEVAG